jgi:hypothetical protein
MEKEDVFDEMKSRWPSAIIARSEVANFTGGLLKSRTLANLDSRGNGPPGRQKMGDRGVFYRVEDLVSWMRERCK